VELQELFKKEVFERGLKKVARANKSGCLDLCAKGPVVVIYPEGVWYAIRTREDVLEIIEKHLERGERVQRLIVKE
jgi:(2Fe-2S) ferredoxin